MTCERACAHNTHQFDEFKPAVCMQCDQFGANFTHDQDSNKCVCDPTKAILNNYNCVCRDYGYVPFVFGSECQPCSVKGCKFCRNNDCLECTYPLGLKKDNNNVVRCSIHCPHIPHATILKS